jgi:insulysin
MQLYPPSHYLSGPYKVSQWEPSAIEECLASLNPDNVLWLISSPTFAGKLTDPQTEKWYGTQYECVELDEPLQNQLRTAMASDYPELALPQVNDMIATDFELLSKEFQNSVPLDKPQCIALTMGSTYKPDMQLWYKPDNAFDMPKVNLLFHFPSCIANATPQAAVATQVFVEWIQEQVNEYTYLASMAGLHCEVGAAPGTSGIDLQVSGYHHKAHVLVDKLLSVILTSLEPSDKDDSELFGRLIYKLEQQFHSFLVAQPYQHAIYGADQVLEEGKFTTGQKLAALKLLDKASVVEHARRFWKDCRMVTLIHGNVSPQHAKDMTEKIWSTICTFRGQSDGILSLPSERRVVQLAPGTSYLYRFKEFNEANTNSCMQMVLQMGAMSLKDNATLAFVHHLIREPAFNQLRTEEQLGYIVHTSIKTSGTDIKGIVILIQSDGFDPIHVESRVEDFLEKFRPRIVDMTEEDFASNVNAVVSSFLEKVRRRFFRVIGTLDWSVLLNYFSLSLFLNH